MKLIHRLCKETHGLIITYGWFDYFSKKDIKILFNFYHFVNFLLYHHYEFYSINPPKDCPFDPNEEIGGAILDYLA